MKLSWGTDKGGREACRRGTGRLACGVACNEAFCRREPGHLVGGAAGGGERNMPTTDNGTPSRRQGGRTWGSMAGAVPACCSWASGTITISSIRLVVACHTPAVPPACSLGRQFAQHCCLPAHPRSCTPYLTLNTHTPMQSSIALPWGALDDA